MTNERFLLLSWIALVFALTACGGSGSNATNDNGAPSAAGSGGSGGSSSGGRGATSGAPAGGSAGATTGGGGRSAGGSADVGAGGAGGKSASGGGGGSAGAAGSVGGSGAGAGASGASGNGGGGGSSSHACSPGTDTLPCNRQRLLDTYFAFLKASVTTPQSNGLSGANVTSTCDVWSKLDPSSQAVFLTLTARMQGSRLGSDGSSMLLHVTKVYRVTGGQGATATDPGSCGGGEYNRMIMSMDAILHDAQVEANDHQGSKQANGKYDIADAPGGTFWRDSHDLGGPHAPFDLSDETDSGAPRGQTQYFRDPTSVVANSPLGRMDLTTLVDPYALEMDQDYDCVHHSNPLCSYFSYGPACFPEPSVLGTEEYEKTYGDIQASWTPTCP